MAAEDGGLKFFGNSYRVQWVLGGPSGRHHPVHPVIRSERLFWNYGGATLGIEFPCDKRGKGFCGPAMT